MDSKHWRASSLTFRCIVAADDFGSDEEDNDFGEEDDEDGGSDYEEKKGKKGKKAKVEKPSKRGPKRKRAAGKNLVSFFYIMILILLILQTGEKIEVFFPWNI